MKKEKPTFKLRLRVTEGVSVLRTFSASIKGGARGYPDCCALETFSNEVYPSMLTFERLYAVVYLELDEDNLILCVTS